MTLRTTVARDEPSSHAQLQKNFNSSLKLDKTRREAIDAYALGRIDYN